MHFKMKWILSLSTVLCSLSCCTLTFAITNDYLNASRVTISNQQASYTDTKFDFSFQVNKTQTYNRIYIDTTQNPNTGFPVGGIGAKYLLENNNLYAYVGPGWNWSFVKEESFTNSKNISTWVIGRDDIGNTDCAGAFNYVSQVQTSNNITTGANATLKYTSDPSCPTPPPPPPPPPTTGQKLAIPSYFDPCTGSSCGWTQLDSAIPQVGIAVINPDNGPGSSSNPSYLTQTQTTHNLGASVLGYVWTNYGAVSLATVEAQVDQYYSWYNVDGIFFDGGYSNDCSMLSYYQTLNAYVKAKGGQGLTVVNYGTDMPSCYITASDILINFEDVYSNYVGWTPASWYVNYPSTRFWQIIYDTPQANAVSTVQLASARNAGWVYVTNETGSNPYGSLPSTAYWNLELGALN